MNWLSGELDGTNTRTDRERLPARTRGWHSDAPGLEHRAAPDSEVAAQQRRVVEHETPLAMRGAVPVDKRDVILLEQSLRKLERVVDGRRGADELRMRPIEGAYPLEPADHVG